MRHQQTLWITNQNADDYEDRFDGEAYYFAKGDPVEVPVEGANLMFGYGEDNKTSTLMRAGKAATANDLKTGLVWLANFTFSNTKPPEQLVAPAAASPEAVVGDSAASGVEHKAAAKGAKPVPA